MIYPYRTSNFEHLRAFFSLVQFGHFEAALWVLADLRKKSDVGLVHRVPGFGLDLALLLGAFVERGGAADISCEEELEAAKLLIAGDVAEGVLDEVVAEILNLCRENSLLCVGMRLSLCPLAAILRVRNLLGFGAIEVGDVFLEPFGSFADFVVPRRDPLFAKAESALLLAKDDIGASLLRGS